jgi:hypothetical protein
VALPVVNYTFRLRAGFGDDSVSPRNITTQVARQNRSVVATDVQKMNGGSKRHFNPHATLP